MFSISTKKTNTAADVTMNEFKRLWNEELMKVVDKRDFSKAYNFALRKSVIRDTCLKTYFDFASEDSQRFIEACNAFDEGDLLWTFMLIRQFASVPGNNSNLKYLTNKRRVFLSEKRKDTIITRHTARKYLHTAMQAPEKVGEDFIENALSDIAKYEKLKAEGKYKSAYKIAALTEKTSDYPSNIKKYLYYAAKRPITPENEEQTKKYFEYVGKYYNFKRKTRDNTSVVVNDIDIIIALLIFMLNGGDVSREEVVKKMHRTVKVYCSENFFSPICILADYLYHIGEIEMERMVLKILVHFGEAISDKYKKRCTFLELMSEDSNKFIFRHRPHTPLECVNYDSTKTVKETLSELLSKKDKNSWCLAIKHMVKTYEFKHKFFYDDKFLSTLETVLDNEFGDYVLEYSMRSYFDGDDSDSSKYSMLIITSGKNQYSDFPKIGIMVKIEPITRKFVNVHYCVLYLPDEEYTEETLEEDSKYITSIIEDAVDSRFKTFSLVVENLVWNTVNDMLNK